MFYYYSILQFFLNPSLFDTKFLCLDDITVTYILPLFLRQFFFTFYLFIYSCIIHSLIILLFTKFFIYILFCQFYDPILFNPSFYLCLSCLILAIHIDDIKIVIKLYLSNKYFTNTYFNIEYFIEIQFLDFLQTPL